MIYSQSKYTRAWFFVPLKCGWSSFYKLYEDGHLINTKKFLPQIIDRVYVDVFIKRNPYDRVVSLFKNKFKKDILNKNNKDIHKTIQKIFRLKFYKDIIHISFEQYIEKLDVLKEKDPHCFSLSQFYKRISNTPKYIIDINDTQQIEFLLGCKLPHENTTSDVSNILLSNNQKKIIRDIYQEDFILFYSNINQS